MNCFRPVWGLVWADHPDGQQLPSWEGDPQHAGWASGPALRRPGRRIQPRCLAPARLAALAQLQVGLLGGAQDTGWSWELNFIWLERLVFQSHLIQLVPQMMMMYLPSCSIQLKILKQIQSVLLGKGTELTERSRTFSSRWFRNAGSLERKWTTSCRRSLTPPTSEIQHLQTLSRKWQRGFNLKLVLLDQIFASSCLNGSLATVYLDT